MRRRTEKTGRREPETIKVSATLDEYCFLQSLVEDIAGCRYDKSGGRRTAFPDWLIMDSSSAEVYISGTINLEENNETLHIPFTTCSLFTCISSDSKEYRLAWFTSLS